MKLVRPLASWLCKWLVMAGQSLRPAFTRTAALLLAILFIGISMSGTAAAASVRWKKTTIQESAGSWKIDLDIILNRAPGIAHVPMKFSFQAVALYERALVDGKSEPQLTKLPLANQQPIIESVDVGFLDPGTGKIQKGTRFSFHITRDHGFEAGEYEVQIKAEGNPIGGTTLLVLDGQNEVVDRRSMVFEANEKPAQTEKPKETAANNDKKLSPEDDAFWAGGAKEPEEPEAPPPVGSKPGACGCKAVASRPVAPGSLLALLALGLVARRGRRELRYASR